jgi:steroid delta-isomerase-like uncharacterized protein
MSQTRNVDLARRWFEEVWNQKRTDTIRELVAPDGTCQSEGGELRGPEAFITHAHTPLLNAFPDLHVEVLGTVSEEDQVVVRWSARGTHSGDGLGVAASGRRISFRGMTWIRYCDGKMAEGLDCWNQAALMQVLQSGEEMPSVKIG